MNFDKNEPVSKRGRLSGECSTTRPVFADAATWKQLITTGMKQDWSWNASARKYSELYERTLSKARQGVLS